jgi:hypothetical protein
MKKIEKRSLTWMSPEMAGVKRRWRRCVDGGGHAEMAGVTWRWRRCVDGGGHAEMAATFTDAGRQGRRLTQMKSGDRLPMPEGPVWGWRRRDGTPVAIRSWKRGRKEVVRCGGRRWRRRGLDRRRGQRQEEETRLATAAIGWGRRMGEAARQFG